MLSFARSHLFLSNAVTKGPMQCPFKAHGIWAIVLAMRRLSITIPVHSIANVIGRTCASALSREPKPNRCQGR